MRIDTKRKLALRVLSTAALMAMVSSIATAAFADTYYMENGNISITAKEDGNYITQGEINDKKDEGETVITNHDSSTASSNTVTIKAENDCTAKVTLDNVNIDVSDSSKAAEGRQHPRQRFRTCRSGKERHLPQRAFPKRLPDHQRRGSRQLPDRHRRRGRSRHRRCKFQKQQQHHHHRRQHHCYCRQQHRQGPRELRCRHRRRWIRRGQQHHHLRRHSERHRR